MTVTGQFTSAEGFDQRWWQRLSIWRGAV